MISTANAIEDATVTVIATDAGQRRRNAIGRPITRAVSTDTQPGSEGRPSDGASNAAA